MFPLVGNIFPLLRKIVGTGNIICFRKREYVTTIGKDGDFALMGNIFLLPGKRVFTDKSMCLH